LVLRQNRQGLRSQNHRQIRNDRKSRPATMPAHYCRKAVHTEISQKTSGVPSLGSGHWLAPFPPTGLTGRASRVAIVLNDSTEADSFCCQSEMQPGQAALPPGQRESQTGRRFGSFQSRYRSMALPDFPDPFGRGTPVFAIFPTQPFSLCRDNSGDADIDHRQDSFSCWNGQSVLHGG